SPNLSRKGYLFVSLLHNGKRKTFSVHRLVLNAFNRLRHSHEECNHINGDKQDNCLENLEWVTHGENIRHSINVLGVSYAQLGEKNGQSKLCSQEVHEIRRLYSTGTTSTRKLSEMFRISRRNIREIINRTAWQHV
ncbi:unnamed protein product, partial [marine sediment metagenome]